MGKLTSLEQRLAIRDLRQTGLSDQCISEQLGMAYETVRKWRRRYERSTPLPLVGRPVEQDLSSFCPNLTARIVSLRKQHPRWGSKSILHALVQTDGYDLKTLPSASSVDRILKRAGLRRRYHKQTELPVCPTQSCTLPHDRWLIDSKGVESMGKAGAIALINVKDVFSHTYASLYPACVASLTHSPNTEDYQMAIRLAFCTFGLPRLIQTDHASVFYDNKSKSPFPTRWHLWLLALGIKVEFSRVRCPTDQAQVERAHRTIGDFAIDNQDFKNWEDLVTKLNQVQKALNETYPCRSLNNQAPLVACPQARKKQRHYQPCLEASMLNLENVYDYLQKGRWHRWVAKNACLSIGGQLYKLPKEFKETKVLISFDKESKNLVFQNDKELSFKCPIKAISKEELMGNAAKYYSALFPVQLELPLNKDTDLQVRIFDISTGTI